MKKIKILADAVLSQLHACFAEPFEIICYQTPEDIPILAQGCDILICRSTLKVNRTRLEQTHFSSIATASSGIDHIDTAYLAQKGISCFDAKGSNAHAVADYVLSTLTRLQYIQRIQPKTIGIIGAGCVGSTVALRLKNLGYNLLCYDPPRALIDKTFKSASLSDLYQCDMICIHANLHHQAPYSTYHFIDEHFLSRLKPGAIILNAARGGIVDENAMKHFAEKITYCTDVYRNEPDIDPEIVSMATLCTPHIAGHSIEAKYNAVAQISRQLHQAYGLEPIVQEKKYGSHWIENELFRNFRGCGLSRAEIKHKKSEPDEPFCARKSTTTEITEDPQPISNWQSQVLSLYDPIHETHALKNEKHDLKRAFLKLRQAHQYRHDFNHQEVHNILTTA